MRKAWLLAIFCLPPLVGRAQPSCPQLVARFHSALPSRELLRQGLHAAAHQNHPNWFQASGASSLRRSLNQQLHWAEWSREGLQPGETVYWLQQGQLKDMNEKLWDTGGTEYYLLSLDKVMGEFLEEHPHLGRLIHRNYKDRVVVSTLSPREYEQRVLEPLRELLVERIVEVRSLAGPQLSWDEYIRNSTRLGMGRSLEEAHLSLKLKPLGLTTAEWNREVRQLRIRLRRQVQLRGLSWEAVLKNARRMAKRAPGDLDRWAQDRGLSRQSAAQLRHYLKLASVADFLPLHPVPTENQIIRIEDTLRHLDQARQAPARPLIEELTGGAWDIHRTLFLEDSLKGRYVLATDITGLGERALLAQDEWIAQGARLDTLSRVYTHTSRFLEQSHQNIERSLRSILGERAPLSVYTSGDDSLWSLPNMTHSQRRRVRQMLASSQHFYAHLEGIEEPGNPESVADAISRSRHHLFANKDRIRP